MVQSTPSSACMFTQEQSCEGDAKTTNELQIECPNIMCMERVTQVALITNVSFIQQVYINLVFQ